MTRYTLTTLLAATIFWISGCDSGSQPATQPAAGDKPTPTAGPSETPSGTTESARAIPEVDTSGLTPFMERKIGAARQAIRSNPMDPEKHTDLGAILLFHGFPTEAVTCLQHAAKLDPTDFTRWYFLALAHDANGDTEKATAMYAKTLSVQESSGDESEPYRPARLRLGKLLGQSNPAAAIKQFEAILADRPENPLANYSLAEIALQQERFDDAIGYLNKVLTRAPNFAPAHAALAGIYDKRGDAVKTAEHVRAARAGVGDLGFRDPLEGGLQQRGYSLAAWLQGAAGLLEAGKITEGERRILQAIEIDPSGLEARSLLVRLRMRQNRIEDAIRVLRSMLAVRPDSLPTQMELARLLIGTKKYEQAHDVLVAALEQNPTDIAVLERFCDLKRFQEKPEEALLALRTALKTKADDPAYQLQIALLMDRIGAPDEEVIELARQSAEQATDDPNRIAAYHHLGMLLHTKGDKDGARQAWTRAVEINPDALEPNLALSTVMLEAGDNDAAIQLARGVVERNPQTAEAYNFLGRVHLGAGDHDAALAAWQQALKLDPGHAMARLATITIMWQAENRDYAAILASLREGHLSNPADNDIKNSLAWILATCPDEQYRNPEQALEIAQNASRGVNHLNPQFLDTLAAACAANGRFEEAQQHIEQAINLIEAGGQADEETITNFRERQNLYKQNQPYVDK